MEPNRKLQVARPNRFESIFPSSMFNQRGSTSQ